MGTQITVNVTLENEDRCIAVDVQPAERRRDAGVTLTLFWVPTLPETAVGPLGILSLKMHFSFQRRIAIGPHPTLSISLWGQCAMRLLKQIPLGQEIIIFPPKIPLGGKTHLVQSMPLNDS